MQFFKILLSTLLVLLFISCSATQQPQLKPQKKQICKPQPNLKKKLRKVRAYMGDPIFIRIFKEESILEVWIKTDHRYHHLKTYPICAYSGDLGPKLKQGDKQSPEGFYTIKKRQLKSKSNYHKAINIGFPNKYDKYQNYTGSYLMIHGKCSSTGCYAMGNQPIDEIFSLAKAALSKRQRAIGVHIFPFRMTEENMQIHQDSPWFPFWQNLKLGYDIFQYYYVPPMVQASKDKYKFFRKKTKG